MQDRVPLYPGRVKLNPVSGQANTFDLVRADQPTQEGTPLNKASLLNDATAALYGLPNTAVPDDVLSKIKPLIDSANANANTKARIATGSYTGTGTYGPSNPNSLTFGFIPKIVIVGTPNPSAYGWDISSFLWTYGDTTVKVKSASNSGTTITFSVEGDVLSWYANSQTFQCNNKGQMFKYLAIG